MKCKYCGDDAKFKLKNGVACCAESSNKCFAIRRRNADGLKKAYLTGVKVPVFTKEHRTKSQQSKRAKTIKNSFKNGSYRSNQSLKKIIIDNKLLDYSCNKCGISKWQHEKIMLELDHIDGNNSNNDLNNLRFLCPNCHSQTTTYCGKSINSGKKKISDDEFKRALLESSNIREALIKIGLSPRGANYSRAYKLMGALKETSGVEPIKFGEPLTGNPEPSLLNRKV